jgi:hypothetical protein
MYSVMWLWLVLLFILTDTLPALDTLAVKRTLLGRMKDTSKNEYVIFDIVQGVECAKCRLQSEPYLRKERDEHGAKIVCVYICLRLAELKDYRSRNNFYDEYIMLKPAEFTELGIPDLTHYIRITGELVHVIEYDPMLLK